MRKLKLVLISFICVFLFATFNSVAQWNPDCQIYSNQFNYKNSQLNWAKLPNSFVDDFEIDEKGNIWIALRRYLRINKEGKMYSHKGFFSTLGVQVTAKADSAMQQILCLKKDDAGNMWIGTKNGLFCFDGSVIHEIANSPDMPFKEIREIAIDKKNNIWVCGVEKIEKFMKSEIIKENSGIAKFNGEKWTSYTGGNSKIPSVGMRKLTFTKDNSIWMLGGKKTGICQFKDDQWTVYNKENASLPTNNFRTIAFDKYKDELLFVWKKGVIKFDGSKWEDRKDLQIGKILSIFIEDKNTYWLGTDNKGVILLRNNKRQNFYNHNSPLITNSVSKIIKHSGFKYFLQPHFPYPEGTEAYGGISAIKFNMREIPENWSFYNTFNSKFDSDSAISINPKENDLIICTKKDIALYTKETRKPLIDKNKDTYYITATAKNGDLYVITKKKGLCKISGGSLSVIAQKNKIFSKKISKMIFDDEGNIWLSSLNKGVIKCTSGKVTVFHKKNSKLPKNKVYTVFFDSQKRLWAGTSKGVALLEGSSFKTFNTKNSDLPSNKVYSICEGKDGKIYLGTKKGLSVISNNTITEVKEIPNDSIEHLIGDKNGVVWVGTKQSGLFSIDGDEFNDYLKDKTLQFRRIEHLISNPDRSKLWVVSSYPTGNLPSLSISSKLKKTQDKLDNYKDKELTNDMRKKMYRLKNTIKNLEVKAKYEGILYNSLKALTPHRAFISIDIE